MHRAQSVLFFGALSLIVAGISCAQGENLTLGTSSTEGTGASNQGGNGGQGGQGGNGGQGGTTTTTSTTTTSTTTTSTTTTTTSTTATTSTSSGGSCDPLTCLTMCFSNPNAPCGQCSASNVCECVPFDQCGLPSGSSGGFTTGIGGGFPSGGFTTGIGGGFPSGGFTTGIGGGFPSGGITTGIGGGFGGDSSSDVASSSGVGGAGGSP